MIILLWSASVAAAPPWVASGGMPVPLAGDTSCVWGSTDCNACVFDVEAGFDAISDNNGDHTGHHVISLEARDDAETDSAYPGFQPEITDALIHGRHIQGMGRLPIPDANVFVFSRNTGLSEWGQSTGVFAGELGQLRSGGGHLGAFDNDADELNQSIAWITTDDASAPVYLDPVDHYGGLQTLGTLAVVGGECLWDGDTCGDAPPRVDFIDFADPDSPRIVSRIVATDMDHDAGMVGAVRLDSGYFFVLVNFRYAYLSETASVDSATTWVLVDAFDAGSDAFIDDDEAQNGWPDSMQNFNLVTECGTGVVYAVGTNRDDGDDAMHLFRFGLDTGARLTVTKLASKHMWCDDCTFEACADVYVTREGRMVLYSANKEESGDGDLHFEEFQSEVNVCNDLVDVSDPSEDPARALDADCDYGAHYDDDGDGFSEEEGDCDETSAATFPGAPETVDGADNDCDGRVDDGTAAFDDDGDGYCEGPGCTDGATPGDCDDQQPQSSPAGVELADGLDNDCDGLVDEGTEPVDDDEAPTVKDTGCAGCATPGRSGRGGLLILTLLAARRRAQGPVTK